MKFVSENALYFVLLLVAGLSLFVEASDYLSDDNEGEEEPDPSRIIFGDSDMDDDMAEEMEDLKKEEEALEQDMQIYMRELDEFTKNKTRHEAEKEGFGTTEINTEKTLAEYESMTKTNEDRFQARSKELDKEESDLRKLELDLEEEEKELAQLEVEDTEGEKEVKDMFQRSKALEAELEKQRDEFTKLRESLERSAEEEEKSRKAFYGECSKVPDDFRPYLKVYDDEFTRLCYKPIVHSDTDYDEES